MTDWSDTPPTEPGWYWIRRRTDGKEWVARYDRHGAWWIRDNSYWPEWVADHFQFGSRIPSNEELLAIHKQISTLTAERDAAELELEAATQRLIDQEVA